MYSLLQRQKGTGKNNHELLEITGLTQGFYPWITSKESLPKQQMKWDCSDEATCRLTPVLMMNSLVLGQAADPQALSSSPFLIKLKP